MNQTRRGARLPDNARKFGLDWENRPDFTEPIRVLIIDDNRLFTDAVSALFRHQEKIVLVGVAAEPDDRVNVACSSDTIER